MSPALKSTAYIVGGLAALVLAIGAGNNGQPIVAALATFAGLSALILAVLKPRDPKEARCAICGNYSFGQKLCWPCRQRFGDGE